MAYTSFFNRARRHMSVVGIKINNVLHHARPVRECPKCSGQLFENGTCPVCSSTASWRQTNCPKCDYASALVFQSKADEYGFFIFCPKCHKWEFVQGLPKKPERSTHKTDTK